MDSPLLTAIPVDPPDHTTTADDLLHTAVKNNYAWCERAEWDTQSEAYLCELYNKYKDNFHKRNTGSKVKADKNSSVDGTWLTIAIGLYRYQHAGFAPSPTACKFKYYRLRNAVTLHLNNSKRTGSGTSDKPPHYEVITQNESAYDNLQPLHMLDSNSSKQVFNRSTSSSSLSSPSSYTPSSSCSSPTSALLLASTLDAALESPLQLASNKRKYKSLYKSREQLIEEQETNKRQRHDEKMAKLDALININVIGADIISYTHVV